MESSKITNACVKQDFNLYVSATKQGESLSVDDFQTAYYTAEDSLFLQKVLNHGITLNNDVILKGFKDLTRVGNYRIATSLYKYLSKENKTHVLKWIIFIKETDDYLFINT